MKMGTLYIAATPIGNLKDITIRTIDVFNESKYFLTEDSRVTRKLFALLEIDAKEKSFLPFHDHNEIKMIPRVMEILLGGNDVVLVSDAGMPLISDPGFKLVRYIKEMKEADPKEYGILVEVLPGASSILTALICCGMPTDKFVFLGYLPRKNSQLDKLFNDLHAGELNSVAKLKFSYIAFESPYRLYKLLEHLNSQYKNLLELSICNELTKKFQKVLSGTPAELIDKIKKESLKGEITLVFRFK